MHFVYKWIKNTDNIRVHYAYYYSMSSMMEELSLPLWLWFVQLLRRALQAGCLNVLFDTGVQGLFTSSANVLRYLSSVTILCHGNGLCRIFGGAVLILTAEFVCEVLFGSSQ